MPKHSNYLDDSSDEETSDSTNLYSSAISFGSFFDDNRIKPLKEKQSNKIRLSLSFTSHALGIAVLNNVASRELYKDPKNCIINLDELDAIKECFKKYVEKAIDRTIYDLCCKAFDKIKKKNNKKTADMCSGSLDSAYENILTYIEADKIITNAISKCLADTNFYKNISMQKNEEIMPHFEILIRKLSGDVGDVLYSNAVDSGEDGERQLFKEWDNTITTEHITKLLMEKLVQFKPPRKVLPINYCFENKDSKSFIANILIAHRSDKRRIKNLKDFDLYQTGQQETYRSWFFDAIKSHAAERSIISRKIRNCQSWIGNVESYHNIFKAINNIKNNINKRYGVSFLDRHLAQAIINNLNGKKSYLINGGFGSYLLDTDKDQIKELIAALTQLFFGLEAVRNPSSILINHMALDLIINHQYSFQQVLTRKRDIDVKSFLEAGLPWSDNLEEKDFESHIFSDDQIKDYRSGGIMPMSHSGVMAIARRLEGYYQLDCARYMPKHYRYIGSEAKTPKENTHAVQTEKQLIELEGRIVSLWLIKEVPTEYEASLNDIRELNRLLENTVKNRVKERWLISIDINEINQMTRSLPLPTQ